MVESRLDIDRCSKLNFENFHNSRWRPGESGEPASVKNEKSDTVRGCSTAIAPLVVEYGRGPPLVMIIITLSVIIYKCPFVLHNTYVMMLLVASQTIK